MPRQTTVLGIADAGRGAVIGPLILAGILFVESKGVAFSLADAGLGDTQRFSPSRRKEVIRTIEDTRSKQLVFRIEPEIIDESTSLNEVEIRYSARLINKLRPQRVVIDAPVSERMFAEYKGAVKDITFRSPRIRQDGGELGELARAAAKVVAREVHDQERGRLHKRYGDFGSGYPADKKTQQWLRTWRREHMGEPWPDIVRTSWATLKKI